MPAAGVAEVRRLTFKLSSPHGAVSGDRPRDMGTSLEDGFNDLQVDTAGEDIGLALLGIKKIQNFNYKG